MSGICGCGCGAKTRLADRTNTAKGYVKGVPLAFVAGHHNRRPGPSWEEQDCGYETPCRVWRRTIDADHYPRIRHHRVHRLVYEWIHGPIPEGLVIDHLCGNPSCIRVEHLEAVTSLENWRRGRGTKVDAAAVAVIRESGLSTTVLVERFGISRQQVSRIRSGRSWSQA